MDRKQALRNLLKERQDEFNKFRNLGVSKDLFFDAIKSFKAKIVPEIAKYADVGLVEDDDVKHLDRILSEMDRNRTKTGRGDEVYWNATEPLYNKVKTILIEIDTKLSNKKLLLSTRVSDFVCQNWLQLLMLFFTVISAIAGLYMALKKDVHPGGPPL
jgi:hypothetical protein